MPGRPYITLDTPLRTKRLYITLSVWHFTIKYVQGDEQFRVNVLVAVTVKDKTNSPGHVIIVLMENLTTKISC